FIPATGRACPYFIVFCIGLVMLVHSSPTAIRRAFEPSETIVDQTQKGWGIPFHNIGRLQILLHKGAMVINDVLPKPGIVHQLKIFQWSVFIKAVPGNSSPGSFIILHSSTACGVYNIKYARESVSDPSSGIILVRYGIDFNFRDKPLNLCLGAGLLHLPKCLGKAIGTAPDRHPERPFIRFINSLYR